MQENFDCTQFITFNLEDTNINVQDIVMPFKDIGFEIIFMNEIRQVKIDYFKDYIKSEFIELRYDEFIGEFEDWELLDNPPRKILEFIKKIEDIATTKEISVLKIILTSFAEEAYSSNEVIKIKIDNIIEGLFAMSNHYYDIWTDNLIIEII